jgi:hypothetical protein
MSGLPQGGRFRPGSAQPTAGGQKKVTPEPMNFTATFQTLVRLYCLRTAHKPPPRVNPACSTRRQRRNVLWQPNALPSFRWLGRALTHIYIGSHDVVVLLQLLTRVEDRSRIRCLPETQSKDVIQQTSAILGRTLDSWVDEVSNRLMRFYCLRT